MSSTTDERSGHLLHAPSRRTVLRASAWTLPAVSIAVAAPAYAACSTTQPTVTGAVNWLTNYNFDTKRANAVMSNGSVLGVGVSSRLANSMLSYSGAINNANYENLRVSPHNVGNSGQRGLTLAQVADTKGNRFRAPLSDHAQTLTLTFDKPVKNLTFSITDIDRLNDNHADRVFLTPAGSGSRGSAVVPSAGTSGDPWRNADDYNTNLDPQTANQGNVAVDFGPLESLTYSVTFWNANPIGGVQQVFLTGLNFSLGNC